MALFRPTVLGERVTDLTAERLRGMGARALLLDVDNTIATYTGREPAPGALEWARAMTEAGFQVMIVSNNYKRRVSAFAARFGLGYVSFACKPFPFGYLRAKRRMGARAGECAVVGDQIFTDVVGANLCGMRSVLLTPLEEEAGWSFRLRRRLERPLRRRYARRVERLPQGGR